jgi:hypothetical protein
MPAYVPKDITIINVQLKLIEFASLTSLTRLIIQENVSTSLTQLTTNIQLLVMTPVSFSIFQRNTL